MADENKKVTIQFGGYDESDDQTIMFEGPLEVTRTVDNVNLLYTIDVSQYQEGDNIIVFVKNINDPNVQKGNISYRGSFYKYDWIKRGWVQIIIGNHSHANMAILDQLGTIDSVPMKPGERKIISIEKIDPDDDNNIITTDYELKFEDIKTLPDVPEDVQGKALYLSTDKDGNFEWTNSFAPAQTFKFFKIILTKDNIVSDKELIITKQYLEENEIYFNNTLNDEILVFDNGSLLSSTATLNNGNVLIQINENDNNIFVEEEVITFLIIRNGISGLLDTIKNQYITKAEAIQLLTNGTINLNSYITKDDLKKYAAELDHTHSQYLRKDDYDAFDYRYSDYQHTHIEYTTREQVLGIIADAAGETGEIDTDKIVETIIINLENKINELNANYFTKEQVTTLINSAKNDVSNSDAITVTFNGRNLTDYLRYLESKQNDISVVDSDIVELEDDRVNLGEGVSLGGLKSGDLIKKGSTLTQFIHRLITKEQVPDLKKPEIHIEYTLSDNDAGSSATLAITPTYIQNNGGSLLGLTLKIYNSDGDNGLYIEREIFDNEEIEITNLIMNAYNEDGKCFRIQIIARYDDGETIYSNVGLPYFVSADVVNKEITLYNTRKMYFGTIKRAINSNDDLTQDDLYDIVNNSNTTFKYSLSKDNYKTNLNVEFIPESEGRTIFFAIPRITNIFLDKLVFLNQHFDMLDDFSHKETLIPDLSDQTENNIDNYYDVYYYTLTQPIISDLRYSMYFRMGGE